MKTWSCPKKIQARKDTILSQPKPINQYWSMAGLSTTENCEVDQLLKAGFIQPEQFHGVEINREVYEANTQAWPHLVWHHGDFFQVMRRHRDFNPSLVNADLIQTVDTAADYIARILYLLVPFEAILIANFVMEHRGYCCNADYVVKKLSKCPQFRYAMNHGWEYDGRCYLYAGTGSARTIMGTFVFSSFRI